MIENNNVPCFDIRLNEEDMNFLWDAISKENKMDFRSSLAGNISKSEELEDKDNWFYESILKKHTERMFYRDWDNYYKYCIEKEEPPPRFEMDKFWVNYQKQHEFNPCHDHNCLFTFVIFMQIPTHWKDQHALPFCASANPPLASNFAFLVPGAGKDRLTSPRTKKQSYGEFINVPLSPEDEGRMLFFPGWLQHMVYPFYNCDKERITISGNINFWIEKQGRVPKIREGIPQNLREEQIKDVIKNMEIQIVEFKKQLGKKWMEKAGGKEE